MGYLLVVTLIQAFSFSLIGEYLAGHVDSYFAVLVRVVLAGLEYIPQVSAFASGSWAASFSRWL